MNTIDRQSENIHTVEQIKSMGNKIHTRKGDAGLCTSIGNTYTLWTEAEPGLYKPYHAYHAFLTPKK